MRAPRLHPLTALHRGALEWTWASPVSALSSAPVGGGLTDPAWLLNVGVEPSFARTDLDAYVAEIAAAEGLTGPGIALLTAAKVANVQRATIEGVAVDTTVGISKPTWAADPSGGFTPWRPGTINVVVQLPVPLSPAAAVNAVITATEAKTQALHECNVPGTGTASDAVVVVWPKASIDNVPFAGPRSQWGARIAQAVHAAVRSGIAS